MGEAPARLWRTKPQRSMMKLAGRATTCISPPPLRRRDEADALSDDEFEDPFPAGLESAAVPAY